MAFLCQWHLIVANPGIVDSPELRKSREKALKLPPSPNAITNIADYEIKSTTPTAVQSVQTFKITHEDVVLGANSVYGSHFEPSNGHNVQLQGGGILFAVNGKGITSSPQIMTAGELIVSILF